ncbi:MAG: phage terminase large subunit family protein, partial [Candidatus Eisenbacteria sp.]|nr:phage terminase large subunit family protein [Candidatus Eisenbacteria bacterium]
MLINLAKARAAQAERRVKISYAGQEVDGKVREPIYDRDDLGNLRDYGFDIEPRDPTDEEFAASPDYCYNVSPSEFAETAILIADKGDTRKFTFAERPYLKRIYDTGARQTLLKAARQVEKSVTISTICRTKSGSPVAAGDVAVGDELATMSVDGCTMTSGRVSWVSKRYSKPCVRLTSRQGHQTIVALTHPMRVWSAWLAAGDLSLSDRLAVVRQCGEFVGTLSLPYERVILTAYLIGDGHIGRSISLTGLPGPVVNEFIEISESLGFGIKEYPKRDTKAIDVRLNNCSQLRNWLREDGLLGTRSRTKFLPSWVYDLDKSTTSLFLNRLWATDGHVKQCNRSLYSLEYCSTSKRLIAEVQALLWKFGIPSRIRRNWPSYWKKQGIKKYAWILRIETQEGVKIFLAEIASLGKSEDVDPPDSDSRNNRDTFPIEVNDLIRDIVSSRGNKGRFGRGADKSKSLRTFGLRETLLYPPTFEKVQCYVDFFRSDYRYDQSLVDELDKHLITDLYWDRLVGIEDVGEQECVDFAVEGTENFVGDGFITHNSTTLGNKMIAYSCLNNHFRSLFVAPSAEQAKVFSNDRVADVINMSPLVGAYTNTVLTNAVFHKKFINYSQIRLRYAYLTADRVRGIAADLLCVDEIQDILVDNLPVIEECASHSNWKLFIYSGTPKSLDNTIEHYWANFSTQNEWVVPCEHHGTPKSPNSWHWNILDEDNIGKTGLVCDACGKPINPYHPQAQWASLQPQTRKNQDKVVFEGYRIPQLMVPWILNDPEGWAGILQKQERYGRQKFYNEVLGISYDSGTRPITRGQLKACCKENVRLADYEQYKRYAETTDIFAGIDWGCHDDQTRILTQDGWKHFQDLTDDDQVAQWDPETRVMSLVLPEVRTVREWDGPLHHFETRGGLDMMLTGTHRMRVKGRDARWATECADQTVQRKGGVQFVGYVDWEGEELETFTLPGLPKSPGYPGCDPRTYRMDDWLEFLGYVLTEGGVCLTPRKSTPGGFRPTCIKMSQRESVNPKQAAKIKFCMDRMEIPYSEFPNHKTGDLNWTICGKQFWHWFDVNVGRLGAQKRVPREFLSLSKRQLRILFDAMVLGDGSIDRRANCTGGSYSSTSKGLCEDFQELCIRLGLRGVVRLFAPAEGNRKARWRVNWSRGRDFYYNTPKQRIETCPYN